MTKKYFIKEGDIFKIELPSGYLGFGRVLPNTWGFYRYFIKKSEPVNFEEIIQKPVAFKIWVSEFALTKKLWEVIGSRELDDSLKSKVFFYKQDPISNKLWKTETGAEEYPVSIEECKTLEVAAVYDPEHVVRRLENLRTGEQDPFLKYDFDLLVNKGVPTKN
jgi:hypothetical protein